MAFDRIDPSDQIPDADLLEQQVPLDPSPLTDAEPSPGITAPPAQPVDEADRWEQQAPVAAAEDDYPHELDQAEPLPVPRGAEVHPIQRRHLTLAGEIDMANAEDFLQLAQAIIAGCQTEACLTIDLSGVTFMSSSGLSMLVQIRKAAIDAGMELRLVRVPERVAQLLEITALAEHFGLADARLS